jgi:hypothetical protein
LPGRGIIIGKEQRGPGTVEIDARLDEMSGIVGIKQIKPAQVVSSARQQTGLGDRQNAVWCQTRIGKVVAGQINRGFVEAQAIGIGAVVSRSGGDLKIRPPGSGVAGFGDRSKKLCVGEPLDAAEAKHR